MHRGLLIVVGTVFIAAVVAAVLYFTSSRGGLNEQPQPTPASLATVAADSSKIEAPYDPPAVSHPDLKTFVDRTKTNRIPQDSTVRVQRLSEPKDIKAVIQVLNDRQDTPHARNEAMLYLARSSYRSRLPEHLNKMLHDPRESDAIRGYCVHHLDTLVGQTP